MDKSIEKFRMFLEELKIDIDKKTLEHTRNKLINNGKVKLVKTAHELFNVDETELVSYKYDVTDEIATYWFKILDILRILENDEKYQLNREVFSDFKTLSELLEFPSNGLSLKDKFNVITYFFKKALLIRTEKNALVVDAEKLIDAKLENFRYGEISYLIMTGKIAKFFSSDEKLTEKEELQKQEIIDKAEEYQEENLILNAAINGYKNHLLDKMDTYTEKDIKFIRLFFKRLEMDEQFTDNIEKYLLNKLADRNKPKAEKITKFAWSDSPKQESKYISETEYKKGLKEIRKVYNYRNRKFEKDITYKEMLSILEIMVNIKLDKEEIKTFIMDYYLIHPNIEITIGSYISNRAKLLYYNVDVSYLDELLEILMGNDINDIDYLSWKREFINVYSNLLSTLPNSYDYEIDLVSKKR